MDIIILPLIYVINVVLNLYWWAVVIYLVMSWLEAFNIINRYNQAVYNLNAFLFRIVEPALIPIRRFLPNLSGIDLSPVILLVGISFVQMIINLLLLKFV
ncbi:YggT family protein [Candidatus Odyssella acanthamoebae]|uniref:Membrane protein n=1 Tax=Candidatus Odyssella acanthamoebae TaxID=91604 RepID=A0A077AYY1_9PROT|nr:YggT family protein [Candidatus Paracaedibacter acanthamoebae]AIK96838.1 membrane protein [Candidatus Paracaedibacter acanthamoebae]